MEKTAIIVAGGSGTRFASALPKQFVDLCGRPVLMHTIEAFATVATRIVVALPRQHHDLWRQLCLRHHFTIDHGVVDGGHTRFQSVKNALGALPEPQPGDVIAVHDGVRPLVSAALVSRAFQAAQVHGSAVPVVPLTDSVCMVMPDGTSRAMERSALRAVQTPQTFDARLLFEAYETPELPSFTDDASVVEAAGHRITLVDGEPTNIKITHPADLLTAEQILDHAQP